MSGVDRFFVGTFIVESFRCFPDRQSVEFALPNGKKGSGITYLVGENNSGKTTILEGLHLDQIERRSALRSSDVRTPNLKLELIDSTGGTVRRLVPFRDVSHVLKDTADGGEVGGFLQSQRFAFIPARRNWNPRVSNHLTIENLLMNASISGTSFMRPSMEEQPYSQFGDLLFAIETKDDLYFEMTNLIRDVFPSFESFTTTKEDIECITYRMKDGIQHRADFLGDGVVSVIRIAAELVMGKNKMIVIDEPESSLHPLAQRRLLRVLATRAATQQILLSTHSPLMVELDHLFDGARLHRVVMEKDGDSRVFTLRDTDALRALTKERDWHRPHHFDAVAKEVFFYDKILFVEGQDDVALLRRCGLLESSINLFGYGVGGYQTMKSAFAVARELGVRRVAGLLDGGANEAMTADKLREVYPEFRVFQFERADIVDKNGYFDMMEDGTPDKNHPHPRKRGYFTTSGELKPESELGDFLSIIRGINEYFAAGE